MLDYFLNLCFILGIYQVICWVRRWSQDWFSKTFFGVRCTVERYGVDSWAVVTGCTEGIGKAQVNWLARNGFNIVLISRSKGKLEDVARDLEKIEYKGKKCKTKIIVVDFSKDFTVEFFQKIVDEHLKDLDVSILSNNVGQGFINDYVDLTDEQIHRLLAVNLYPVVTLTKPMLEIFTKRHAKDPRIRSAILNTGALMSVGAAPYGQTYGAGKIFGDFLTRALNFELAKYNIDVQCFRPAGVISGMVKKEDEVPLSITADELANYVFNKMTAGVHFGHYKHEFMGNMIESIAEVYTGFNESAMKFVCNDFKKKGH